jgi:hypothetical protein
VYRFQNLLLINFLLIQLLKPIISKSFRQRVFELIIAKPAILL